jgi:hypothetical protein
VLTNCSSIAPPTLSHVKSTPSCGSRTIRLANFRHPRQWLTEITAETAAA